MIFINFFWFLECGILTFMAPSEWDSMTNPAMLLDYAEGTGCK